MKRYVCALIALVITFSGSGVCRRGEHGYYGEFRSSRR